MDIFSNIVDQQTLRDVNLKVLKMIRDSVATSFGPYGSSSQIKIGEDTLPKFTKDGYTILMNLKFNGIIEMSLKEVMEDLVRHVVKEVGDGTTSATMLSYAIFKRFVTLEEPDCTDTESKDFYKVLESYPPAEIERVFKAVVKDIKEEILDHSHDVADENDIYKIALVSTNGDSDLARKIADIYKENGKEVYIDVKRSNVDDDYSRTYDGMTLNTGYGDKAYINNKELGASSINAPRIYFFEDPIDTEEMVGYLQRIIYNNIISPLQAKEQFIPTVVVCPKVSNDINAILDNIHKIIFQYRANGVEIPFLLVPNVHQKGIFMDIARLCNAKTIKKYIDFDIQKHDQENGNAPTMDTVADFYGTADAVVSDYDKTKFINPANMYKEGTTEFSDEYNEMVNYLKTAMDSAKKDGKPLTEISEIKRRYNSLKANMVDLFIGGATPEERDNRFDSAEDAVLNCRSAAENGYGYGANYEGLRASVKLVDKYKEENKPELYYLIGLIISNSYLDIVSYLYGSKWNQTFDSYTEYEKTNSEVVNIIDKMVEKDTPADVTTGEPSEDIISSISSDISILEIIAKLMTILINCKQFICPIPTINYKSTKQDIADAPAIHIVE